MMIMYYVREKLMEALKYAYPDDYMKYSKFYIDMNFKEGKSYSKYDFKTKKITVSTLSRSSGAIYLSYLFQLSVHIDIVQRSETHNDEVFLGIMRKLIHGALCLNIIANEDLYSYPDQLKNKLQERYGSFANWKSFDNIKSNQIYVRVYDAIMIRNILKHNQYKFDYDQNCWQKKIDHDDPEEELLIHEYRMQADFQILDTNRFIITPVYQIVFQTYAKEYRGFLHALNYQYDPIRNVWNKLIQASEFEQELKLIQNVPHQKITIMRNKR